MELKVGLLLNQRYRIQRVLGRGGFGAVYLAVDESLGTHSAIKENLNTSPEAERQFRREATLLATLRHPNLPRVTHHFVTGGKQYLVMDFVEGEDLRQKLEREGRLPVDDVLRIASQIGDALSYLHGLNPPVIHRDIKPENLKITPAGEAFLVDFGIAKEAAPGQTTSTGAKGMTPGFAPPEQYRMGRTDHRTDIYAFGATIYSLLCRTSPPESVERVIGRAKLTPAGEIRPDLPKNISDALGRSMELEPELRFGSVHDLLAALGDPEFRYEVRTPEALGLEALQRGLQTLPPGRPSLAERLIGAGRHPLTFVVGGLLMTSAWLAAFALLTNLPQALREIRWAEFGDFTPYIVSMSFEYGYGVTATKPSSTEATHPAPPSATAPVSPTSTPTPAPIPVAVTNATGWRLYERLVGGVSPPIFAVSPDGSRLAVVDGQDIDIVDLSTQEVIQRLQGLLIMRQVVSLAYLQDSLLLQSPNEILHWSIDDNRLMERLTFPGSDLLVSPDGSLLAIREKYVSLVNLETRGLLTTLGDGSRSQKYAFSPDGDYFVITLGKSVELWDARAGRKLGNLVGHGEPTMGLAFSPDGAFLISASGDIWETQEWSLIRTFDSAATLIALDPTGTVLVGDEGSVWELASATAIGRIPVSPSQVRLLQFSPDGRFLLRQTARGDVELWTVDPAAQPQAAAASTAGGSSRQPITNLNLHELRPLTRLGESPFSGFALSPDGTNLAAWSGTHVTVLDTGSRSAVAQFQVGGSVSDVRYAGDANLLVLVSGRSVERWSISSGQMMQTYRYSGHSLGTSAGGDFFAVQDKYIQVVDLLSGNLVYNLGSADSGQDYAFSPDGSLLAISAGAGVGLWDMGTGRLLRQLAGHGPPAMSLVFTPDGRLLLSASGDVWDIATARLIASFDTEASRIAMTHDAGLVVGADGSVWDGKMGWYLGDLSITASQLAIRPDDQILIYRSRSGEIHEYAIAPSGPSLPYSGSGNPGMSPPPISSETSPDLSLFGWWGSDRVLESWEQRSASANGPKHISAYTYRDIALSPAPSLLAVLTESGVDLIDELSGDSVSHLAFFLNPSTIREIAFHGDSLLVMKGEAGIELWDVSHQQLERRYNATGHGLQTSSDGRLLAVQVGNFVQVIEIASGDTLAQIRCDKGEQTFGFSPRGSLLAVVRGGAVELWSMETGRRDSLLAGHGALITGISFTPDGSHLVAASGDIWDLGSGIRSGRFQSEATVSAVSPAGNIFATNDGAIRASDTGARLGTLFDMRARATQLLFSADGRYIFWRVADGRLFSFAVQVASSVPSITQSSEQVTASNASRLRLLFHIGRGRLQNAVWAPNGTYLAINTTKNTLILEVPTLDKKRSILGAKALAFDDKGNALIGGHEPLKIVNITSGEVVQTYGQTQIEHATFSRDGRWLAIGGVVSENGGEDGLAIVELETGTIQVLDPGQGSNRRITRLSITPDSRRLVASFTGEITIWDIEHAVQVRSPITNNISPATVSADGHLIAFLVERYPSCAGRCYVLQNLATGGLHRTINADGTPFFPKLVTLPRLEPMTAEFTDSGKLLIIYRKVNRTTGNTRVAGIEWDSDSPQASPSFDNLINLTAITGAFVEDYEHDLNQAIPAFGLSPDGRMLYSLTGDGIIRLWSYPGGELRAAGSTDPLDMIALSPDGHTMAIPDALGGIDLYDPSTGDLLKHISTSVQPSAIAFRGDSILSISQQDGTLSMIDLDTGLEVESFHDVSLAYAGYSVFSSDGRLFARWDHISGRTQLNVFGMSPGQPILHLGRYPRPNFLQLSGDGRYLAVAKDDSVDVWDLQQGEIVIVLKGQSANVGSIAFTPDNEHLVSAGGQVWSLADGSTTASFDATTDMIALSPNGQVILGGDGTMWNLADGRPLDMLRDLRAPAIHFAFTPDCRYLIWQTAGGVVEVWGVSP